MSVFDCLRIERRLLLTLVGGEQKRSEIGGTLRLLISRIADLQICGPARRRDTAVTKVTSHGAYFLY